LGFEPALRRQNTPVYPAAFLIITLYLYEVTAPDHLVDLGDVAGSRDQWIRAVDRRWTSRKHTHHVRLHRTPETGAGLLILSER
jgi:hypothetical protein